MSIPRAYKYLGRTKNISFPAATVDMRAAKATPLAENIEKRANAEHND